MRPRIQAARNWGTDATLQSLDLLKDNLVGPSNSMRALHRTDGVLRPDVLQGFDAIVGAQLTVLVATQAQLKSGQTSAAAAPSGKSP